MGSASNSNFSVISNLYLKRLYCRNPWVEGRVLLKKTQRQNFLLQCHFKYSIVNENMFETPNCQFKVTDLVLQCGPLSLPSSGERRGSDRNFLE
jgi:hypothetical protein